MARIEDASDGLRKHLENLPMPSFENTPAADGPPLSGRRIALISTAGLSRRGDRPFGIGASDYRLVPGSTPASELMMSHISVNFDRTGFQQDINVVFPLDRLNELAGDGTIGSVADIHYSVMGATDPAEMEPAVDEIAAAMKAEGVTGVVLLPV